MASLSQIVRTKGYKNFMAKLYGWGASLVLVGALFKLQHWQGAGLMLVLGMSTEAIIFFFSAFEPLPNEYHWDKVFPELGDGEGEGEDAPKQTAVQRRGHGGGGGFDLGLDASDAENAKKSIKQFNQSMESLSVLASIADTSGRFVEGLNNSVNNMRVLNESMQVFSNAYQVTAKSFVENGEQSNQNLNVLNRNLSAVNASYELYIQGHQKYAKQNDVLISSMQQYVNQSNEMMDMMKVSGERTKQFSAHMEALNQNIHNLNNIYGSMLTTVSSALKR